MYSRKSIQLISPLSRNFSLTLRAASTTPSKGENPSKQQPKTTTQNLPTDEAAQWGKELKNPLNEPGLASKKVEDAASAVQAGIKNVSDKVKDSTRKATETITKNVQKVEKKIKNK